MLIAEELLLLLTDDETGKSIVGNPGLDLGLAGANLLDLALRGKVDVAGEGEAVKRGRIVVRDADSDRRAAAGRGAARVRRARGQEARRRAAGAGQGASRAAR